jgi:CBS domain-containing protein
MSRNVVTMSSESNALEVAKMMLERKISSILLTDETNKIVGIVTERDLLREVCGKNVSAQAVVASSVMSKPLMTIDKNSSIEDAAKLMAENRVRHIAVEDVKNYKLIGVISTIDLASYLRKHVPKYYEVAPTLFEALYCE